MGKRLTTEEFVKKARLIHGDQYDYSESVYIGKADKVKVTCRKCKKSKFIAPANHYICGCKCDSRERARLKIRKTTDYFVKKARKKHGDNFDYSEVNYIDSDTKVIITHKKCGNKLLIRPHNFLKSDSGCRFCSLKAATKTTEQFIKEAKKIHKDKFDYSETEYINNATKLKIKCKKCKKSYLIFPSNHVFGYKCPFCVKMKKEDFVKKAKRIHGNKYDYTDSVFNGTKKSITIFCKKCQLPFTLRASGHITSNMGGCQRCIGSTKEKTISDWLARNKIKFRKEKTFKSCINPRSKNRLRFDFFISPNVVVEYHGRQHFQFVKFFFKDEFEFKDLKKRDEIKKSWAKSNNYQYHMIRYDENVIDRLEEIFKI